MFYDIMYGWRLVLSAWASLGTARLDGDTIAMKDSTRSEARIRAA